MCRKDDEMSAGTVSGHYGQHSATSQPSMLRETVKYLPSQLATIARSICDPKKKVAIWISSHTPFRAVFHFRKKFCCFVEKRSRRVCCNSKSITGILCPAAVVMIASIMVSGWSFAFPKIKSGGNRVSHMIGPFSRLPDQETYRSNHVRCLNTLSTVLQELAVHGEEWFQKHAQQSTEPCLEGFSSKGYL